jgi:CRP/FNR family cyclic AMP-dependent transcriptional regulator
MGLVVTDAFIGFSFARLKSSDAMRAQCDTWAKQGKPKMDIWLIGLANPSAGQIAGYLGAGLILISFFRTTMIPLRALGAASNLCFIAYAWLLGLYPTLVLHALLFPLNCVRLGQMIQLVRRVQSAAGGDRAMDWLRPFMRAQKYRAGEILFRRGDTADTMFYVVSGSLRLTETGIRLPVNALVGELGLLAPDNRRTQGLECETDGELLVIGYDQVRELYFQNPEFGFYLLQLTTSRLFEDLATLEQKLAEVTARNPP